MDLKNGSLICKIIQLVFCIISTALITEGPLVILLLYNPHHIAIFHVAVSGYILINTMIIIGNLVKEQLPKKTALIFTVMGTILTFTAGVVLINDWSFFSSHNVTHQYINQIAAAGFFAVFAAVAFAIDIYFTIKYE